MKSKLIIISLLAVLFLLEASVASARPNYLEAFNQHYNTEDTRLDSCYTCHSGGTRNPYGLAYAESGKNFTAIEGLDSDGDGFTNLVEINALSLPGNPDDYPQDVSESETSESETPVNVTVTEPSEGATEQSATEVPVSNATPEQPATETPASTTEDEQSPGFEFIPVLVGLLAVVYLMSRGIRK